ncbi:MAG TPA: hypothetical protein VHG72_06500 [Polyangia bacterium]|nr:hypothetical protein [Polyangia bacterium]
MRKGLSISLGLAIAASAGWSHADPPPPTAPPPAVEPVGIPGARIAVGQAPVVGGNAAGARERALDEAIRQAIDLALAELVDAPTRAAQAKAIRTLEAKARTFVPRYRTLEEGEANGVYTVRLQAEVDDAALRARIERWSAGPAATEAARPTPDTLFIAFGDGAPQTPALVNGVQAALSAAGVRARVAAPPLHLPPTATVARLSATVSDAGSIRGTARVAAACTGVARFTPASTSERQATAFGFGDDAAAASAACLAHLGPALATEIAGAWSSASARNPDLPVRTIDADVTEPAAVAALLKSVRAVGVVSSADLVRVGGGHAEIRARTRSAPGALAEALVRDADATLTLSDVQAGADTVSLRVRLRAPAAGNTP